MGRFTDLLALGSTSAGANQTSTSAANRRETVSRTGGVFGSISGSDRIAAERVPVPTDAIAKYWNMYQTVPLVRASFNQFRDDVMANGYRAEADRENAETYLENWSETAASVNAETYLENWSETAASVNAERNRDLHAILRELPIQLPVMGTALLEHSPAEADEDKTAGVQFIHPATVTPYRASDTNLLLRPDDTEYEGAKLTEDGEAAAYVQFDAGPGKDGDDERRLTLEDVTRMTIDGEPSDVFGTSRIAPVAPRIEAVKEKLKNNDRAVQLNAWRSWFLGFGHETVKNEDGSETVIEWEDDDMDEVLDDMEGVEPGDIEGIDGTIDVTAIGGDVADIVNQIKYETHWILTAMPAPTYSIGFESDINQFVVEGQQERHEQRIEHFRRLVDRNLRPLARSVLNQADRDPSGARWVLEAPPEDSPVLALTDSEIERMKGWSEAFAEVSGGEPRTLVSDDVIREKILQLEDAEPAEQGPEDAENGGLSLNDLRDMSPEEIRAELPENEADVLNE